MLQHVNQLDNLGRNVDAKLRELRELDDIASAELAAIREMIKRQLESRAAGTSTEGIAEPTEDTALWDSAYATAEKRSKTAWAAYEAVDKHIHRIDKEIEELASQISADRAALGMPPFVPGPPALLHLPQPQLPPLPSLPLPDPTLAGDMISNAGLLAGAPLGAGQAGGVFVDKVYCFCQRPGVEGGRMVGCDNAECPYEWIHFECAGISEEPEGEWFCQECRAKMAGRKRGKAQRGRRK